MRRFASMSAGLFACVTGCGDDGGARKLPDAPPIEDGMQPDMLASGTVNVTTMSRCCTVAPNTPEPGILVVAINADGTLAATATTGADGKASLTIREGAMVSAVYPEDAEHQNDVHSYVGVKPDDNLTFGEGYYTVGQTITGATGQMILNWTAVANAVRYRVYTPCEDTSDIQGLTTSLSLGVNCQTPTSPLLITALDTDYRTIASAYLPAATTTVGATVNITAAQWVSQPATGNATVSVSGLDPIVQYAYLRVRGQFPHRYFSDSDGAQVKAGAATATLTIPGTAPVKYAELELSRSGNFGRQYHHKGGQPPYAFTASSMPWIEGQLLASSSQRRALWFETPGTYDAAVLYLEWTRSENKQDHNYNWTIILPPNVAELRFPDPPAELAPFLPTSTDYFYTDLTLVDLSSAASYDAARALPEWRLTSAESAVANGDEPMAGIATDGEGFSFTD